MARAPLCGQARHAAKPAPAKANSAGSAAMGAALLAVPALLAALL